jgi:hypothetical protein
MVTAYPRACNSLASEADIIPFPNEEATPPVTNIYFVGINLYECYFLSIVKIINHADLLVEQFNILF